METYIPQSWEKENCLFLAGKVGEAVMREAADSRRNGRIEIGEEVVEEQKSLQVQAGVRQIRLRTEAEASLCVSHLYTKFLQHAATHTCG